MNNNPICNSCITLPCAITVQSIDQVKQESNAFVYVEPTNTTYYVDGAHKVITLMAGPVYYPGYNYIENPLNLRGQTCYDFVNNVAYHYNNSGKYRIIKLETQ